MIIGLSAKAARLLSLQNNLGKGKRNQGTMLDIQKLILVTATQGFSIVAINVFPQQLDYLKNQLPDYKITSIEYEEPNYPDVLTVIISW